MFLFQSIRDTGLDEMANSPVESRSQQNNLLRDRFQANHVKLLGLKAAPIIDYLFSKKVICAVRNNELLRREADEEKWRHLMGFLHQSSHPTAFCVLHEAIAQEAANDWFIKLLDTPEISRGDTEPQKPCSPSVVNIYVTMVQQSTEMAALYELFPFLTLTWNKTSEVLNSQELRTAMVDNIRSKSNMAKIVNESVLSAMKVVPRHVFTEAARLADFIGPSKIVSDQALVNAAYLYNKPIPATMTTNESSPEIIGTQLSMTAIVEGHRVLLVGMKGGYIQSLVAQLVGPKGLVVTVTSDAAAMQVCRDRVNQHCPHKGIVQWLTVDNAKNHREVVNAVQQLKQLFHTVIYCGATVTFPVELKQVLVPSGDASIMAVVKKDSSGQQFQLYVRRGSTAEMRTVTDFGVIFEDVK